MTKMEFVRKIMNRSSTNPTKTFIGYSGIDLFPCIVLLTTSVIQIKWQLEI